MSEQERKRQQRQSQADSDTYQQKYEQGHVDRIVYFHELKKRYGKSRTTIWRWVKSGWMPAPVQVGPNSVGWWESSLRVFDEKITAGANNAAV